MLCEFPILCNTFQSSGNILLSAPYVLPVNMSKPIALIFGAGKRVGASTAEMLAGKGYRVALAARSLKSEDSTQDSLHLTIDLSNAESVNSAFATLRKQWGEPSVIVYNGEHFRVPWPRHAV